MINTIKILIVEHEQSDIDLLQYELKKGGLAFVSEVVQNEQDYCYALKNFSPDIILSDFSLPSFDGPTAFKLREQLASAIPFIFVSGNIGEENSVEYIRNGVTDYALKDKLFTLPTKVERALKESREKQQKNRAEQELIQRERQLARAQKVAHMGSWELDLTTNIFHISDEACSILGLVSYKNILSFKAWMSFVYPADRDFVLRNIKESRNFFRDTSYSHRIVRRDGSVRHVYSESRFEFGTNGRPASLYGIVHDITEIKQAEAERTKMLNDLIQRNKELEQFAYIVSHNLRAPVANILGAINVLQYPGLGKREQELLNKGLGESVTNLDKVIKDLNYILQVKGEIDRTKEKVCFPELVNDVKLGIRNLASNGNAEIRSDFSEVDHLVTVKSYLYSIFYNLISNSIKYRQPQVPAVIDIKSRQSTETIELIFADNGMGIDLEKKGAHVFGLYKRFHDNIDGNGMGLFMVKSQTEALGGRISIKSEVNKGTEFKIEFDR